MDHLQRLIKEYQKGYTLVKVILNYKLGIQYHFSSLTLLKYSRLLTQTIHI